MSVTLSVDEQIVEEARTWAAAHGTSLNALVRDFLARLGSDMDREATTRQFEQNARTGAGRSAPGTKFNRSETYRGVRFEGTE